MPYDYDEFNNTESGQHDDNILGYDNSSLLSVRDVNIQSGDQQSGETESGEVDEDPELNSDYFDILGDLYSSSNLCNEQIDTLIVQLDNLNENVVTLNENLKVGVGLLFTVTIILGVKVIFNIFNKILGLGSA